MKFDLHCHSTASDGKLSPEQVFALAEEADLDLFALTDHDSIAGFQKLAVKDSKTQLVSGVELSAVWSGVLVHIIGLDFDTQAKPMQQLLARQQQVRLDRAAIIDAKLAVKSMPGCLAQAQQYLGDDGQIGRPHIAQAMVDLGYVVSVKKAFEQGLKKKGSNMLSLSTSSALPTSIS